MLPNALFEVFGRGVYMYGICIALGIVACLIVLFVYAKKRNIPAELTDFIFFVGIFAIAIGFLSAMLFQAVYNWIDTGIFNFYSGLTVMGGIVGGVLMFLLAYFIVGKFYFKGKNKDIHKKHFCDLLDIAPCCITIAHAFGRVGCLMAGCCHGEYLGNTYTFGGIYMHGTTNGYGYYVPTQLYEALFLFALFAVLSIMYYKRYNILSQIYLIAYAVWRIFIEFFRADSRGELIGAAISPSQWQSLIFIIVGVLLLVWYRYKKIPFRLPLETEDAKQIDEKIDENKKES